MLDTTNSKAIENIISYFDNTMKTMKKVEYKIWANSYKKNKGNYEKLLLIRNNYRFMKKLIPDINLFKKDDEIVRPIAKTIERNNKYKKKNK